MRLEERFEDSDSSSRPQAERLALHRTCGTCGGLGFRRLTEKHENGQETEETQMCRDCQGTGEISVL